MSKIKAFIHYFFGFFSISITIILMYIFPNKSRAVRKGWAKYQTAMLGAKLKINGEIDKDAKLYIINHRSMLDIIAIESFMPNDPCWVAKQEITDIPWFGRINHAGKMISIDREDKKGLITLLKEVKEKLDSGRVIMIFPEGTRSKNDKLLEFKAGAKLVAEKYNLKVQPIVVHGTDKVLDTQSHSINSGTVYITFLESFVAQKENDWFEASRVKMQEEYTRLSSLAS
ncbi:MAG: 1-acyl-sn-glycerol-3-phosphate acyltransferase [Campylobacterota bacterium]|nr:1-acyl-sn-glycerol-3-phosphate acyltransferase [Campylobacterota bacterium]